MKYGQWGWVFVAGALIVPVALFEYQAPTRETTVRPGLVPHPFASKVPEPDVEPEWIAPAPEPEPEPEPAQVKPSRDPFLSPLDLERINAAANPPPPPPPPVVVIHPPKPKPVVVQAIIAIESQPPRAIVNGALVGEGDRLGKLQVLRITEAAVEFSRDGKRFSRELQR